MKDKYLQDILARHEYISQNMPKKDPFDKGIMRAVQSAKKSLAMDAEQEDAALRDSILTFGEEMHKMPKTRGFMGNFAQVGRAMAPAIRTHDASEEEAKSENMKMLQYAQNLRAAEEAKIAALEQQAYSRQHAAETLAEQKNYHQQSLLARFAKAAAKKDNHGNVSPDDLNLTKIKNQIRNTGKDGSRGLLGRFANKITFGAIPLTAEQAKINTLGDVLRGKLFNAWGYRNQAEFEHVPSVSPDNSMETNLAIIGELENMLNKSENISTDNEDDFGFRKK